jgi:hypothetical protein
VGTTCTNTYGGDHAWDPNALNGQGAQIAAAPTVTVSQTKNLTNQMVHVSWTNFTPSITDNGTPYERSFTQFAVGIYECRTFDPQLDPISGFGGPNDSCYSIDPGAPPTAGQVNSIKTFTSADGTGSADFQIETSVENNRLGCTDKQPCSLMVIPNWGGWQEPIGAPVNCADHSQDPGGLGSMEAYDTKIGYACSWADRLIVPLSFAPTPAEFCPPASNQFAAEGGAALEHAVNQWRPAWCVPGSGQTPTFFDYNSAVDEYQARRTFLNGGQALTASTDLAMVNRPPAATDTAGSQRRFTYAPLSLSGIAIAYYVDNHQTGLPVTDLTLNARLVAKLLTQSYSLKYYVCASGQTTQDPLCDPAVAGNPTDLYHDPEFQALNPQYTPSMLEPLGGANDLDRYFLPTVLAGNSDLTYELTRWIESDPAAKAFLQGQPDDWHMHVNSYYKNTGYPIAQFLPQDPGWIGVPPGSGGITATMQLSWNPVTGLDNVVHRLTGNSSNAFSDSGTCSDPSWNGGPCHGNVNFPLIPPETLGARSLFAVVDAGSAAAFRFPTAKLVNWAGNAVAPTPASMTAGLNAMQTNPDQITQFANFANTDPNAYPLTMAWYAMAPTCGLAPPAAQAIARVLNHVAGSAQQTGVAPGQLPPFGGYVPLTDAQRAQTAAAAQAVASQSCVSAPPDKTVSGQTGSTVFAPGPGSGGFPGGGAGSSSPGGGAGSPSSGNGNGNAPAGSSTHPAGASSKPGGTQSGIPLGLKGLDTGGWLGLLLPIALGVGGAIALIAGCVYLLRGTDAGQALLMRFRRWLGLPPPMEEIGDAE